MIPNKVLTPEDKEFIRENSETMWMKLIAEHCDCSEHIVEKFIRAQNLPIKAKRKPWGSVTRAPILPIPDPTPKPERRPYVPGPPPYQFYKPMYL